MQTMVARAAVRRRLQQPHQCGEKESVCFQRVAPYCLFSELKAFSFPSQLAALAHTYTRRRARATFKFRQYAGSHADRKEFLPLFSHFISPARICRNIKIFAAPCHTSSISIKLCPCIDSSMTHVEISSPAILRLRTYFFHSNFLSFLAALLCSRHIHCRAVGPFSGTFLANISAQASEEPIKTNICRLSCIGMDAKHDTDCRHRSFNITAPPQRGFFSPCKTFFPG